MVRNRFLFGPPFSNFFFIMLKYTEYNIQHFNHFEVYSSVELNHLRCAAVTTVYLSAALSSQAETVSPRNDRPDVPHPARGHTTVPPVSRTSPLRLAGGGAWRDFAAVPLGRVRCRLSRSAAQLSGRAAQGHFCRPSCRWRPDFANRMFRRLPVTFMPLKPLEAWPVRACVQNPLGRAPPPRRPGGVFCTSLVLQWGGGGRRHGPVPQFPVWSWAASRYRSGETGTKCRATVGVRCVLLVTGGWLCTQCWCGRCSAGLELTLEQVDYWF